MHADPPRPFLPSEQRALAKASAKSRGKAKSKAKAKAKAKAKTTRAPQVAKVPGKPAKVAARSSSSAGGMPGGAVSSGAASVEPRAGGASAPRALGCTKCRMSSKGCVQCRNPKYRPCGHVARLPADAGEDLD